MLGVGLSSGREQVTYAGPRGRSEPDDVGTSFGRWAPGWLRGVVRLAGGGVARGEFPGFRDLACEVQVFGGVDVEQADAVGVGAFELFVGKEGHWRVVGCGGFFDVSRERAGTDRHCR